MCPDEPTPGPKRGAAAAKSVVLAKWIEVYELGMQDGPETPGKTTRRRSGRRPPRWEFTLFVNRCTARRLPSGREVVDRVRDVVTLGGDTQDAMSERVVEYCARDGVRRLMPRVKANESGDVPRGTEPLRAGLVDGTDAIYRPPALDEIADADGVVHVELP